MGDVLKIKVINNSNVSVKLQASADRTQNWSGYLDGKRLDPGDSLAVSAEKDDLFIGGGVFAGSQIRVTFVLADEVVVQNGPISTTYPRVRVAKVEYDDATWQAWTGGGYALAMSPPYPQLNLDFTIANDASTITIS